MIKNNFTIKEVFSSGWNATKNNAWFLFVVYFVSAVLMVVTRHADIIGGIVSLLVGISLITISLVIVHGKTPAYDDTIKSFKSYKIVWHYILATILYALAVIAGLILLILPGIYLAVRLQFYKFLVVDDENMGPIDALKKSMDMTQNHFWKLLGFILLIVLLNIIGALFFVVGLIITVPVSLLASAFLYKKLLTNTHEAHNIPSEVA